MQDKRNNRNGQPKGENYRMDKIPKGQDSEGTKFRRYFSEGTLSEGTEKKREKKRIARQHKLNEGEERKIP